MSGGVDSSVAAYLLMEKGYNVFGITMEQIPSAVLGTNPAHPVFSAAKDAANVCRHLDIPHYIIDLRSAFRERIIEYFVEEYLRGRTPNPCVLCNVKIKWGALFEKARILGAEYFATGHYARIQYDQGGKRMMLLKARHEEKDQSYALWRLQQNHLRKTIFPLGEMKKSDVRAIAEKIHLPVARKNESQEICFIVDNNYQLFLQELLRARGKEIAPGDIFDAQNNWLGQHRGYPFYTIGQRKGLGVSLGRPVYVTHIDAKHNRITLGDKKDLYVNGLIADQVNLVSVKEILAGTPVELRIRYKDPGYKAYVDWIKSKTMSLHFEQPRPAVTPGQSAVLYDGQRLLAGGVIRCAIN